MPIRTDALREVLANGLRMAIASMGHRTRWSGMTYTQARTKFYTLIRKLELTKVESGVTPHRLQHQYAQERTHKLNDGHPTAIEVKEAQKPTLTYNQDKITRSGDLDGTGASPAKSHDCLLRLFGTSAS